MDLYVVGHGKSVEI